MADDSSSDGETRKLFGQLYHEIDRDGNQERGQRLLVDFLTQEAEWSYDSDEEAQPIAEQAINQEFSVNSDQDSDEQNFQIDSPSSNKEVEEAQQELAQLYDMDMDHLPFLELAQAADVVNSEVVHEATKYFVPDPAELYRLGGHMPIEDYEDFLTGRYPDTNNALPFNIPELDPWIQLRMTESGEMDQAVYFPDCEPSPRVSSQLLEYGVDTSGEPTAEALSMVNFNEEETAVCSIPFPPINVLNWETPLLNAGLLPNLSNFVPQFYGPPLDANTESVTERGGNHLFQQRFPSTTETRNLTRQQDEPTYQFVRNFDQRIPKDNAHYQNQIARNLVVDNAVAQGQFIPQIIVHSLKYSGIHSDSTLSPVPSNYQEAYQDDLDTIALELQLRRNGAYLQSLVSSDHYQQPPNPPKPAALSRATQRQLHMNRLLLESQMSI